MSRSLFDAMGFNAWAIDAMVEGNSKEVPLADFEAITPRLVMQTLGTEWGRDMLYQDFWVDIARTRIERLVHQGQQVVVDDLRFPNEYATLLSVGATLVKIVRPGIVAPTHGHPSEGQLEDYAFDVEVTNAGSVDDLRMMAATLAGTVAS